MIVSTDNLTDIATRPLRTFLAIELDEPTRQAVEELVAYLQRHYGAAKIKWTPSANLHITTRFIGTTAPQQLPVLCTKLREALTASAAFNLALGEVIFFPVRRPHVLALDVPVSAELQQLAQVLEHAVGACGFTPEERPFQPHLTLARFAKRLPPLPKITTSVPSELPVQRIVLFNSENTTHGSRYIPLAHFPLRC